MMMRVYTVAPARASKPLLPHNRTQIGGGRQSGSDHQLLLQLFALMLIN